MGRLLIRSRRRRAVLGGSAVSLALLAAVGLGGFPDAGLPLRLEAVKRHPVRKGIEVVEANVVAGRTFRGRLVAIYADLAEVEAQLVMNRELSALDRLLDNGWVIINAGYFTAKKRPTGLLVASGQVHHPFVPEAGSAGSGILVIKSGRIRLIERDAADADDFEAADLAIQAGPRVIENDGSPGIMSDDGMRANRTVIGYDGLGRLAIAVVYGPDAGMGMGATLFELQRVLGREVLGLVHPDLAFSTALNLDGGPSSGLHSREPAPTTNLPPMNRVVSALRLTRRSQL